MYKTMLFDLDGTLTDPKEGITKSVAYGLEAVGIPVQDTDTLTPFIGPPLKGSFQNFFNLDEEACAVAIREYRKRFEKVGYRENKVYDGVEELLGQLRSCGVKLGVATAKPQPYGELVLEYYNLTHFFDVVSGGPMDEIVMDKAVILASALQKLDISEAEKPYAVMIGDRDNDILAAKACGITSVGVRFGYAGPQELEIAQADYVIDSMQELKDFLLERAARF